MKKYKVHKSTSGIPFALGVLSDIGIIRAVNRYGMFKVSSPDDAEWHDMNRHKTVNVWFERDGEEIICTGSLSENMLNRDEISDEDFKLTRVFGKLYAIPIDFKGYVTGEKLYHEN